jgi:hypothetical protein
VASFVEAVRRTGADLLTCFLALFLWELPKAALTTTNDSTVWHVTVERQGASVAMLHNGTIDKSKILSTSDCFS